MEVEGTALLPSSEGGVGFVDGDGDGSIEEEAGQGTAGGAGANDGDVGWGGHPSVGSWASERRGQEQLVEGLALL